MKSVVVTGVSTGIGYAICKTLINQGVQVFGSVRRDEDAARLTETFGKLFIPLIFDITHEEEVKRAAMLVRSTIKQENLWGLVNNAGVSVPGPLMYLPIADFEKQIAVNLTGQLIVTQQFLPLLGAEPNREGKPGKIINISSVAGVETRPFLGAYSASKHGLEAISETLRLELKLFGIDVIVIGPGAIESAIWDKAESPISNAIANSVYAKSLTIFKEYMLKTIAKEALPAGLIGQLVFDILNNKKTKRRYAPRSHAFLKWSLSHLLPKSMIDWLIAKKLGLTPQK